MNDKGWFKASLADAEGVRHPKMGLGYLFGESHPYERFQDLGINVRVLEPEQPASLYHAETAEEFFVVLGGECLAIVEDEEVPLRRWDYLHCPPGTAHLIVGAGDGRSTVLMVGGRKGGGPPHYPVSEKAARYGASVTTETNSPQEAWAQTGLTMEFEAAPLPWPPS